MTFTPLLALCFHEFQANALPLVRVGLKMREKRRFENADSAQ
jgi:hypothetical protein